MLRDELRNALSEAMREKNKRKISTIRLILAAVKDNDIAARTEDRAEEDDDAIIFQILSKMIRQRRESVKAYQDGGRDELAEQELEEIAIIEEFLPRQMSDDEIKIAVEQTIKDVEAEGLKDIGRVMGVLKGKFAGRMDFGRASALVKEALA